MKERIMKIYNQLPWKNKREFLKYTPEDFDLDSWDDLYALYNASVPVIVSVLYNDYEIEEKKELLGLELLEEFLGIKEEDFSRNKKSILKKKKFSKESDIDTLRKDLGTSWGRDKFDLQVHGKNFEISEHGVYVMMHKDTNTLSWSTDKAKWTLNHIYLDKGSFSLKDEYPRYVITLDDLEIVIEKLM